MNMRVDVVDRRGAPDPGVEPRRGEGRAYRTGLRDVLPEHLVPTAVVALDALPLTLNGELDRAAPPAPSSAANAERPRVAPRTDLERLIARVWRDVLGIPGPQPMGIDENFVDLGGHSLHAARVVAAIRRTTRDLRRTSVLDLFAHPTVRRLAAFTAAAPAGVPPVLVLR
jgi:Phosphopantetheine attachment site